MGLGKGKGERALERKPQRTRRISETLLAIERLQGENKKDMAELDGNETTITLEVSFTKHCGPSLDPV
jgi:hypothetical protein